MKLISCYIENFGSIKRKEFVFDGKITEFFEENGAGKTTLASFIKAMFYGLESYKINSVGFSDRQHFYPFDGGAFGGNLTFEFNGNIYKIVRFFGEKSELSDTLQVYKGSEETNELGLDIGKAVFGIDKASFERTLYIGADEIEIKSTSNINAKLNSFTQGLDGDNNVEKSLLILDKKIKEYKKSRQGKDKISEQNELILGLLEKISNARLIQNALEEKYALYAQIEKEIDELSVEINRLRNQNQKRAEWERYNDILTAIENSKAQVNEILSRYPYGIPTEAELKEVTDNIVKDKELNAQLNLQTLSENDKLNLIKLSEVYEDKLPSKSDVESIQQNIDRVSSLSSEISLLSSIEISDTEKELNAKFNQKEPLESTINEVKSKVERCKELKLKEQSITAIELDEAPKKAPSSAIYIILAILFAGVGVAGMVTSFANLVLGVVLGVVGFLCLIFVGFIFLLKKMVNTKPKYIQTENYEKQKLQIEISNLESSILGFLQVYGYNSNNGAIFDFAVFSSDFEKYKSTLLRLSENKNKLDNLTAEKAELINKLNKYFSDYSIYGDNYLANLSKLLTNANLYIELIKRSKEVKDAENATKTAISENKKAITAFSVKYNITKLDASSIISDIKRLKVENESIKTNTEKAEIFKKEKNISTDFEYETVDLSVLEDNLSQKQSKLSSLKVDIISDEYEVDKIDGYLIDKSTADKNLSEYKQKHKLLSLTYDAISKAEQNLKEKYVKPIKDEFLRYANLLENVLGEKVVMTKDFELRFERFGKERSEKHLSSGIKSICAFCFRLALIKNMYKGENLFIVLDDPFVNLDSQHIEKVKKVINELSSDTQIIYFTCHESRLIK